MRQALEFLEECECLAELLSGFDERDFAVETKFKRWTVADIVRHLAVWDTAARLTLQDGDAFERFFVPVPGYMKTNSLRLFERETLPDEGKLLFAYWRDNCRETAQLYATADPKTRLKWGGPGLSARTCITSRLMETWSHSQAIFDEFGVERIDGDRIRSIVQIGIQTFGWTFQNRGLPLPGPIPSLELTAPNGQIWRWPNAETDEHITGSATEFCQVVTQTRNVADTQLHCDGAVGRSWMAIAQCFAGPPSNPPRPGERFRNPSRNGIRGGR